MSTAVATRDDAQLVEILGASLYPGASSNSINLVLSYCRAANLDPMQKPVHIVPMWNSKQGQMQDVVMPGIGLYRTQAARTGQFAGMSEPEFGPMLKTTLSGVEFEYPEWCKVTAKRQLANGYIAEFTAVEFWMENYAVKGGKEKSIAPNAMWLKRSRGQLAKCAGAQATRMGFPEVGAAPTAEEMEGKSLDDAPIEGQSRRVTEAPELPELSPELEQAAKVAAEKGTAAYAAWFKSITKDERYAVTRIHETNKARASAVDAEFEAAIKGAESTEQVSE